MAIVAVFSNGGSWDKPKKGLAMGQYEKDQIVPELQILDDDSTLLTIKRVIPLSIKANAAQEMIVDFKENSQRLTNLLEKKQQAGEHG